jgi:Bacterial Ig-like domain
MVLALLSVAACAGNGEGLDANGNPLAAGSSGSLPPLSADFASIQANIFTPICSVCHIGGGAPEGLRLDAADSYNLLVGVPSTEVPSLLRVKPGDPNDSYIIQKLEGHAAVGAQMPDGCPSTQPCLTTTTIAFIAQWITDGAQPAAATATATVHAADPPAVTSIVPDDVEPVSESPPQIMVAFNHDLDVTQIDSRSMHIEKIVPGESSASTLVSEVVPARVSVSSANLRALMVWPSRPLVSGHYRLVINAGAPAQVSDMAGNALALGAPSESGESVISTFDVEVRP